MLKAKIILSALGLMLSSVTWSMDWLPVNTIDNLRIDNAGNLYGNTTNNYVKNGCDTTNFRIMSSQPGFKEMYSMLLSAVVSQRTVQLSLGQCDIATGGLIIDGIKILKN